MDKASSRLRVLALLVALMFVALSTRLWFLQVLATDRFEKDARSNSVRIVATDPLRGKIYDDHKRVLVGNDASIIGLDGVPVPAKITQVSPALDAANTTVEVWVEADNKDGKLRPGASARVEMVAKTVPNALVIPQQAVMTSPTGATFAVLIDKENKPHLRKIAVGIRDAGKAQINDGLTSGDRVATTGAYELFKLDAEVLGKTKVQIAPAKEEEEPEES